MATAVSSRFGVGTPPPAAAPPSSEAGIEAGKDDQVDRGDWVSAQPFRAQLRHLMAATGLPWRALSLLAGAEPEEVRRLLQGTRDGRPVRKIRVDLARRLYALTADSIREARSTKVGVDRSAAGLERLVAAGWTMTELSGRLRIPAALLRAIAGRRRPTCSRLAEVRILAAAQTLETRFDHVAGPAPVRMSVGPTRESTDAAAAGAGLERAA